MKVRFFVWCALLVLFYFLVFNLGLPLKKNYGWDWNYTLLPGFFLLTYLAIRWNLLEKESFRTFLPALAIVLSLKFVMYGIPQKIILNKHLLIQIFPSFFEELLFRGVLLRGLSFLEKDFFKGRNFPFLSVIVVSLFFAYLHPPERFAGAFELAIFWCVLFLATRSYLGAGVDHFLSNVGGNIWS